MIDVLDEEALDHSKPQGITVLRKRQPVVRDADSQVK